MRCDFRRAYSTKAVVVFIADARNPSAVGEPQRTIFEKMILSQLADYKGKVILVRGLPGSLINPSPSGLIVHSHLPADTLNRLVCGAALILCRPGYSSVMDLLKLQKKCIFVPTPGQTEQEYLGNYLAERRLALCQPQSGFSLSHAITAAGQFPFVQPEPGDDLLQPAIAEWVRSLIPSSAVDG